MTAPVQVGPSPTSGGPARPLNVNQQRILAEIAAGRTFAQIAHRRGVNERAIEKSMERVRANLGALSTAHAVMLACRAGILDGRPQRHGDHAGYVAHTRRGEDPCDACDAGEKAYRAGLRANRKRVAVDAA